MRRQQDELLSRREGTCPALESGETKRIITAPAAAAVLATSPAAVEEVVDLDDAKYDNLEVICRVLASLGWSLTVWGEPLRLPLSAEQLAGKLYVRAVKPLSPAQAQVQDRHDAAVATAMAVGAAASAASIPNEEGKLDRPVQQQQHKQEQLVLDITYELGWVARFCGVDLDYAAMACASHLVNACDATDANEAGPAATAAAAPAPPA